MTTAMMEDDRLLGALALAVGPVHAEPSPAELNALRSVVARSRNGHSADPSVAIRPRWYRRPLLAAAAAAVVLVSGGTAVATAKDAPLTRPVRVAAHAVGLPVDSSQLLAAKASARHLREALTSRDHERIRAGAAELRDRLADLSAGERGAMNPEANQLLARADADTQQTGNYDEPDQHQGGQQGPSSTPASPSPSTSAPDGDDGGHQGNQGGDQSGSQPQVPTTANNWDQSGKSGESDGAQSADS